MQESNERPCHFTEADHFLTKSEFWAKTFATNCIPQASLRTFRGTSTGASSCDVFGLVPPHMPSMQGAGKTSNAPTKRGLKASNTHKRRSKLEQGIRRIGAMLGAAVPGLAPGSNSKAPTKQNPPTACVPHPVIIAVAPRIPRDGPQQRTNVLKPVPQPPSGTRTRIEGGLWNPKLHAVFLVAQTMSMRSIDPSRRWGSRGRNSPPGGVWGGAPGASNSLHI